MQDALTETVLPAVRTGLHVAREKGHELLASDPAQEARRRGTAMLKIARGEPVVLVPARRRAGFILMLLAAGAGIGVGISALVRRMAAPATWETYERVDATPATTPADDIDLRTGAAPQR